jgi:hypothetical protein
MMSEATSTNAATPTNAITTPTKAQTYRLGHNYWLSSYNSRSRRGNSDRLNSDRLYRIGISVTSTGEACSTQATTRDSSKLCIRQFNFEDR